MITPVSGRLFPSEFRRDVVPWPNDPDLIHWIPSKFLALLAIVIDIPYIGRTYMYIPCPFPVRSVVLFMVI